MKRTSFSGSSLSSTVMPGMPEVLLWKDDSYYVNNSLQVFITRLRQRLKEDPSVRIVNTRGIGYKLIVDITKK